MARYSHGELLEALRTLAADLGHSPTTQELQARSDLPSPSTYINRFESWNAALEAAGLEPRRRWPACTDEQLLQILRDFAAELGRTPSGSDMLARQDLPTPGAYQSHFGTWKAALQAAGLELRQPIRTATYSDERLLEILRDLAAELGRSPTVQEMLKRRDLPRPETYHKRFGSWNAALEAAGLKTRRHCLDYTDEQLLQILRDLAAELGKTPTQLELRARPGLPSSTTYQRRFGTWRAALRAAGVGDGGG